MGERIYSIRKSRKLTQETLAKLADITPTNLSYIERGKIKGRIETIVALAMKKNSLINIDLEWKYPYGFGL